MRNYCLKAFVRCKGWTSSGSKLARRSQFEHSPSQHLLQLFQPSRINYNVTTPLIIRHFSNITTSNNGNNDDDTIQEAEIVESQPTIMKNTKTAEQTLQRTLKELHAMDESSTDDERKNVLIKLQQCYESLSYWSDALETEQLLCEKYYSADDNNAADYANSLYNQGKLQMRLENISEATNLYQKAIKTLKSIIESSTDEKEKHEHNAALGNIKISVAGVHFHKGDFDAAINELKSAETFYFGSAPVPHISIIKCYRQQGLLSRVQEEYQSALEMYQKGFHTLEAINEDWHAKNGTNVKQYDEHYLSLKMDIADMLLALGKHNEALEMYQNIKELLDTNSSSSSDDTSNNAVLNGVLLHNLGRIYSELGDYNTAASLLEQSIAAKTAHYGNAHHDLTNSHLLLGAVYATLKNKRKALENFQTALMLTRMYSPAGDEEDPQIMLVLRNIAILKGEKVPKWGE